LWTISKSFNALHEIDKTRLGHKSAESPRWGIISFAWLTANTPFSQWGEVFVDPAMTLAAVDRLAHHSTILEMNVES
jgi:hypothetical protein